MSEINPGVWDGLTPDQVGVYCLGYLSRSEQVPRFASIILTNGKDFRVIHMLTVRREQKVTTIFVVSVPYIVSFYRLKKCQFDSSLC
jgi:hypothetical protein